MGETSLPDIITHPHPHTHTHTLAPPHTHYSPSQKNKGCRTVVAVIHQPSSEVYDLFDQLCLLSAGLLVYFGPAKQALSLFEQAGLPCPMHRNEADHFLHSINKDFEVGWGWK